MALPLALTIALATTATTASSTVAEFVGPTLRAAPERLVHTSTITTSTAVTVRIDVEADGTVARVELARGTGTTLDEAVQHHVAQFVFEPARYRGEAVPVQIDFTQRFEVAPPPPPLASDPPKAPTGILEGRLEQRGTRRRVSSATILVEVDGETFVGLSGRDGRFEIEVKVGSATVTVVHAEHLQFKNFVRIEDETRITVGYLLQRKTTNPYEVIVTAERTDDVISTTKLRDREIKQVPGTFGDPFRVVSTLPGVSQATSLLPFPVVRGSSPGNTGFLIDGVRVPLLFHLLAGPSVIHPLFIDEIEFSPGGFPVQYGGYTGGIVNGRTRPGRIDERRYEIDINMFQAGAALRVPLPDLNGAATVAGRFGYPGILISLADPRTTLNYWDYQARFDGGDDRSGFSIFVLGARDSLDRVPNQLPDDAEKESFLRFGFHRVDLSYRHRTGALGGDYRIALGYDETLVMNDDSLRSFSATPRLRWGWEQSDVFELRAGLDGLVRSSEVVSNDPTLGALAELVGGTDGLPASRLFTGGALAEAVVRPFDGLVVRPGVRVDLYDNTEARLVGVDPRILARYQILETPDLWLKGGIGLYHQPPRFTIPLPGLDQVAFSQGLLESLQTSVGAELSVSDEWSFDAQAYFNHLDPIIFDVAINPDVDQVSTSPPTAPPGQAPVDPPVDVDGPQDRLDRLLVGTVGRSFGVEFLLRRKSRDGVSGWISYTFSRADRNTDDAWVAYDFDRAHILNAVTSIPLPRDWHLGLRGQLQSGRPLTTTEGPATARTSTFVRFDIRVDKTVTWNDWLLDFYVDVANVVLASEEVAAGARLRYVLPALGFRAIF